MMNESLKFNVAFVHQYFFQFTQSRVSDDQSVKVHPSAKLIPTPLTTTDVWRRHTSIPTDGLSVQRLLPTEHQLVQQGCGIVWDGNLQKCDYPIQERPVNCKITQSLHTPWMLIRWPRLEFTRFARRGQFAHDIFPLLNHVQ